MNRKEKNKRIDRNKKKIEATMGREKAEEFEEWNRSPGKYVAKKAGKAAGKGIGKGAAMAGKSVMNVLTTSHKDTQRRDEEVINNFVAGLGSLLKKPYMESDLKRIPKALSSWRTKKRKMGCIAIHEIAQGRTYSQKKYSRDFFDPLCECLEDKKEDVRVLASYAFFRLIYDTNFAFEIPTHHLSNKLEMMVKDSNDEVRESAIRGAAIISYYGYCDRSIVKVISSGLSEPNKDFNKFSILGAQLSFFNIPYNSDDFGGKRKKLFDSSYPERAELLPSIISPLSGCIRNRERQTQLRGITLAKMILWFLNKSALKDTSKELKGWESLELSSLSPLIEALEGMKGVIGRSDVKKEIEDALENWNSFKNKIFDSYTSPGDPSQCPDCNNRMRYINKYNRWYCDRCQEYK